MGSVAVKAEMQARASVKVNTEENIFGEFDGTNVGRPAQEGMCRN